MTQVNSFCWTSSEAEAVAARLRRIWNWTAETGWVPYEPGFSEIYIQLSDQVLLRVWKEQSALYWEEPGARRGTRRSVSCSTSHKEILYTPHDLGAEPCHWQGFLTQWLPLFRRGCWLLGFDIDASMHERMEWTQGFSKEEIESWKLKI